MLARSPSRPLPARAKLGRHRPKVAPNWLQSWSGPRFRPQSRWGGKCPECEPHAGPQSHSGAQGRRRHRRSGDQDLSLGLGTAFLCKSVEGVDPTSVELGDVAGRSHRVSGETGHSAERGRPNLGETCYISGATSGPPIFWRNSRFLGRLRRMLGANIRSAVDQFLGRIRPMIGRRLPKDRPQLAELGP